MGTYGKPNKILFIALISGGVDFSERTQRLNKISKQNKILRFCIGILLVVNSLFDVWDSVLVTAVRFFSRLPVKPLHRKTAKPLFAFGAPS